MIDNVSDYNPSLVTGIFGGTFDPVHRGHLSLAKELLTQGVVDHVIFMPAAKSPHKLGGKAASPEDRIAMLERATAEDSRMSVSRFEIDKGGISYSIDTVTTFAGDFGRNLRMIIGMDSLKDLHKWYRSKELVAICPIITYRRPGYSEPDRDTLINQFGAAAAEMLLSGIVDATVYDISSTDVRKQIKQGNLADSLIPEAVLTYIKERSLYN